MQLWLLGLHAVAGTSYRNVRSGVVSEMYVVEWYLACNQCDRSSTGDAYLALTKRDC